MLGGWKWMIGARGAQNGWDKGKRRAMGGWGVWEVMSKLLGKLFLKTVRSYTFSKDKLVRLELASCLEKVQGEGKSENSRFSSNMAWNYYWGSADFVQICLAWNYYWGSAGFIQIWLEIIIGDLQVLFKYGLKLLLGICRFCSNMAWNYNWGY
jgi:hypothetical protein